MKHRAARFVFRNYNWNVLESSIVQDFGWKILAQRRSEHSLKLMYKVVSGQSELEMPRYLNQNQVEVHVSIIMRSAMCSHSATWTHTNNHSSYALFENGIPSHPNWLTAAVWTDTSTTEYATLPLGLTERAPLPSQQLETRNWKQGQ